MENITFNDAIKISKANRSILLGNGFSQSLYGKFNYQKLYDVAKQKLPEKEKLSPELINIFNDLNTCDFEKVLAYINVAVKIAKHYHADDRDHKLFEKMNNDLKRIRSSFIKSISYIHPHDQSIFLHKNKQKVRKLLSNFSKIFTLSYDLLLYWIIMAKESDKEELSLPDDDGFSFPGIPGTPWLDEPIWYSYQKQKIFYLHGAFHLFSNGNIYKLKWNESGSLIEQISDKIDDGLYPLVVFEGKSEKKLEVINKNPYLWYSYQKFRKLKGSLFILGSSLNQHSDNHIIDAIRSSELQSVFIGLHKNGDNSGLKNSAESLKSSLRDIYIFDSETAMNWNSV